MLEVQLIAASPRLSLRFSLRDLLRVFLWANKRSAEFTSVASYKYVPHIRTVTLCGHRVSHRNNCIYC